ncbi:actin patch protein 1 [Aspergillus affinis]|uniref:actin patch protein 1 n=1 Tax=Aspergillus affinis TaxID=1070780 RepID=UPI0022FE6FAD|nr:actin patch protein 1 [Aspergillus affinis]KAI9046235.1 actin patch protein 1 [Aspergillus affinis]
MTTRIDLSILPPPRRSNTGASTSDASVSSTQTSSPRPPPQRPPQSYPAAAATAASAALQYASERLPWAPSPSNLLQTTPSNSSLRNGSDQDSDSQSGLAYPSSAVGPLPNRREEMWRRRWERAHDILADHGVVLGSWRGGNDVQDVCTWLVEEAFKEAMSNAGGSRT